MNPSTPSRALARFAAPLLVSLATSLASPPSTSAASFPVTWTPISVPGPAPAARYNHVAIHDPVRDRMIVCGGNGSLQYGETWALALGRDAAWTPLVATGTPPDVYAGSSAIYDPVRDRMVVFGGTGVQPVSNGVWALNLSGTPAWTTLAPAGTRPPARVLHSAVYDPVGDRMLVFGGAVDPTAHAYLDDVWSLSLSGMPAWTHLLPAGTPPAARLAHAAAYDPDGARMVVFGGGSTGGVLADAWALSLSGSPAWTPLAPEGTPPSARYGHVAVYDAPHGAVVVSGGYSASGQVLDDAWGLSLPGAPEWSELAPTGSIPGARAWHTAIADPSRGRIVVFGGYNTTTGALADAWSLWPAEALSVGTVDEPGVAWLRPPAPNPGRDGVAIAYAIARPGRVRLAVYDVGGRLVRELLDAEQPAGARTLTWDGTAASGGRPGAAVYFVRLAGPGIHASRRVVLLR